MGGLVCDSLRILLAVHHELLSALFQIMHRVIAGFVAVTDEGCA
jgi:hypothetical protein